MLFGYFINSNNSFKKYLSFVNSYSERNIINLFIQLFSYVGNSLEQEEINDKLIIFKQLQDVTKIINQYTVYLLSKYETTKNKNLSTRKQLNVTRTKNRFSGNNYNTNIESSKLERKNVLVSNSQICTGLREDIPYNYRNS